MAFSVPAVQYPNVYLPCVPCYPIRTRLPSDADIFNGFRAAWRYLHIFDTTGMYYPYFPLTVHSFAWHILLILIGIYAGRTGKADASFKGFAQSAGIFLSCCLLATLFNLIFHPLGRINMFYISPYYQMGQIVFRKIARIWGNTAGILCYLIAILVGAGLLHLIWKQVLKQSLNTPGP